MDVDPPEFLSLVEEIDPSKDVFEPGSVLCYFDYETDGGKGRMVYRFILKREDPLNLFVTAREMGGGDWASGEANGHCSLRGMVILSHFVSHHLI